MPFHRSIEVLVIGTLLSMLQGCAEMPSSEDLENPDHTDSVAVVEDAGVLPPSSDDKNGNDAGTPTADAGAPRKACTTLLCVKYDINNGHCATNEGGRRVESDEISTQFVAHPETGRCSFTCGAEDESAPKLERLCELLHGSCLDHDDGNVYCVPSP